LGQEVEPPPVDQQVKPVQAKVCAIPIHGGHFFCASKEPSSRICGTARRNCFSIEEIVSLVQFLRCIGRGQETRSEARICSCPEHCSPIFVRDPQPSGGFVERDRLSLLNFPEGDLLQACIA